MGVCVFVCKLVKGLKAEKMVNEEEEGGGEDGTT